MKVKAIVTVSMALLALAQSASAICYKYNPLKQTEKEIVDCPMAKVVRDKNNNFATADNMFDVQFSCDADEASCKKAEDTFKEAGRLITQQLALREPIVVTAQFKDICTEIPDCEGVLGAAGPAQTIELLDEDNVTRMYPQALVKQFQFDEAPQFGPSDIDAFFNSRFDFHFFEDGDNIPADKQDFLTVVLHEYIHGLGFTSGWNEYINANEPQELTPLPQVKQSADGLELDFIEMCFDRYMVANPGGNSQPMPEIAAQIKEFGNTPGSIAPDEQTLITNFKGSAQGDVSRRTFQLAVTDGALGFVPTSGNTDALILETSLDPFRQGSSISHLDSTRFTGNPDFLMRFAAEPGKTLQGSMQENGATEPIGPGTVSLLNTLGYPTADNPNPYKPRVPGTADASDSGSSDSGSSGNGTDTGSDGTDTGTDTGSDGTDTGTDTGSGNGEGNGNDEPNNNGNDNGNGNEGDSSGNGNNNGNDNGGDGGEMPEDPTDGGEMPEDPTDGGEMPEDPTTGEPSTGEPAPGEPAPGEPSTGEPAPGEEPVPDGSEDGSSGEPEDPFGVSDQFEGTYSARFRF